MTAEMITAIGALVAGIGGIVTAILMNLKTQALLEYRMQQVERKLDEHNKYADKMGSIEVHIAEIQTDIKYLRGKAQ
jgi:uncharacterized protein (DUF697 family)